MLDLNVFLNDLTGRHTSSSPCSRLPTLPGTAAGRASILR